MSGCRTPEGAIQDAHGQKLSLLSRLPLGYSVMVRFVVCRLWFVVVVLDVDSRARPRQRPSAAQQNTRTVAASMKKKKKERASE